MNRSDQFDAYGNAIGFDPSVALTEFLYSGEQFDSKIGQQYLRARYYDPATGKFNHLDPFFGNLNDPQSLHKYLYTDAPEWEIIRNNHNLFQIRPLTIQEKKKLLIPLG